MHIEQADRGHRCWQWGYLALLLAGVMLGSLVAGCRGTAWKEPEGTPAPARSSLEEQVAVLSAQLERWESFGFSGAVLIARGDEVMLARGYGLADRGRVIPVTTRTLFDIGSLSKQFTAAAVLKLADAGRLEVQSPISRILPGVPPDKQAITIHHVLTHTSGISDFGKDGEPITRDDLVREILAAPLAHAPGLEYEYSNLGYTLLAALVEIASERPFEEYLHEAIFEPAGLRSTGLTWAPPPVSEANLSLGYGGFSSPCEGEALRQNGDSWRLRGSGSVLSTVEDLRAWESALVRGEVLKPDSLEAMFTPHTPAEADFISYGYGWRIQATSDGGTMIWHSGLDRAYSSMMRRYVEEDVVLIFLSNLSTGGVPFREILVRPSRSGPPVTHLFSDAISSAPHVAPAGDASLAADRAHDASLAAYRGAFRVGEAGRWEIEAGAGVILLSAEGQEAIDALFPPADTATSDAHAKANDEASLLARSLAAGAGGDPSVLDRIDPLGYARRDARAVAAQWQQYGRHLGQLQETRILGTTSLRSRRPDQRLTWLRLIYEGGSVDEHVIWFAEDEIYVVPCRPSTFEVRFLPDSEGWLTGFDPLSQQIFRARLLDGQGGIAIRVAEREIRGSRLIVGEVAE